MVKATSTRSTHVTQRQLDDRQRELARIHIGKKRLALDDDTYRAMLWTLGRVHSSKDLDHAGRRKVLDHMRRSGFVDQGPSRRGAKHIAERPRNFDAADRAPLYRKIEAMLASQGRAWAYAEGIASRMFGLQALEFAAPDQLHKIAAALQIDIRRRVRADLNPAPTTPTPTPKDPT